MGARIKPSDPTAPELPPPESEPFEFDAGNPAIQRMLARGVPLARLLGANETNQADIGE